MKEAREIETAFKSFLYDVSEATSMLIYALAGIEVYRKAFPTQPEVSIPPAYVRELYTKLHFLLTISPLPGK